MKLLAITTFAVALAFTSAADAKPAKNNIRTTKQVEAKPAVEYREVTVGDPSIVYHQIGTSGAQRDNTIIPFYGEPIRSSRPYEVRYDYSEFR